MAETIDIVVPDLGDFEDVEIIEVLVSAGDQVEKEDGLVTLETDKAAMDVPAPEAGMIEALSVSTGDRVSAGDVIGRMEIEAEDTIVISPPGAGKKKESDEQSTGDDDAPQADSAPQDDAPAEDSGDDAPAGGGKRTLVVPDIGDFEGVEVIEVHVASDTTIEVDDPIVTLETDKAAMEVPAEAAGRIQSVEVEVGDKVSEGDTLVIIEAGGTAPSDEADESDEADQAGKAEKAEKPKQPSAEPSKSAAEEQPAREASEASKETPAASRPSSRAGLPPINEAGFAKAHASPSVRKLARELGVDLVQVDGSGAKGRIMQDDVKAFVKKIMSGQGAQPAGAAALPEVPKVDFSKYGKTELEPLTRIQKISGPRLQASWINLPHVTQHDQADITELEQRRQQLKGPAKERGISLTPLAFIIKASVAALKEFPRVNSSLADDGEHLVFKHYVNIGFAADTDQGLVVPVIRDADKKDVYELAAELGELSQLARDGKLKVDQMTGATFTISSLGGIGGTAFTPIVNAPEVAILGVSRHQMQPVWNGKKFAPRLMLPLSFSYDHRVIDGAMAVRFTTFLGEALGDVDTLLQAIP